MQSFVDETAIEITSGNGGSGAVSFRREKYVPLGGPDGGDGGRGGSIKFIVQRNLKTLAHLKMKQRYRAKDGESGRSRRKHGKDGEDVIIPVPPGSVVKDRQSGITLKDLVHEGDEWTAAEGGKGGRGNWHYRTSTNQAPRYAQQGLPGKSMSFFVELDIIADVGFAGLPNAGKSTLLSVLTNANPKIAHYPFTTKIPNLGVLRRDGYDVILADIPGIIEGASHGAGLGLKFLKHISRTACIAFIIDMGMPDPCGNLETIKNEIKEYSRELLDKRSIIIGTKLDLPDAEKHLEELAQAFPEEVIFGVSSVTRRGVKKLEDKLFEITH